jgi:hypothetical protein
MPDRFPVLKVNSGNQNEEFMRILVSVETLHFHWTLRISVDFRVSCLKKRFLMKGRGPVGPLEEVSPSNSKFQGPRDPPNDPPYDPTPDPSPGCINACSGGVGGDRAGPGNVPRITWDPIRGGRGPIKCTKPRGA